MESPGGSEDAVVATDMVIYTYRPATCDASFVLVPIPYDR
jgi:hypothetical protein